MMLLSKPLYNYAQKDASLNFIIVCQKKSKLFVPGIHPHYYAISMYNIFELKIGLSLLCNLKKKCHDDLKCQNIATCNVFGTNITKYFLNTKA